MKKLIFLLTVLLSCKLNAMEEKTIARKTYKTDKIKTEEDYKNHSKDEFPDHDKAALGENEPIMSNEEYDNLIQQIIDKSLDQQDSNYDYGCMAGAFDKALYLGIPKDALYFFMEGIKQYAELNNLSLDNQIINFVIEFIKCIILEEMLYESAHSKMSKEEFKHICGARRAKMLHLHKQIKSNKIDINNINKQTCWGMNASPLLLAIYLAPSATMVKFLIKHGIDLNVADQDGNTPLHILCSFPENKVHDGMIKRLIKNGADIHAYNNEGNTPFLMDNKINISVLFKVKNAHINSTDDSGNTLLNIVCSLPENYENLNILKYLLAQGADITIENESSYSPLKTAKAAGNHKMCKILQKAEVERKRYMIQFSSSKPRKKGYDSAEWRKWVLIKKWLK